MISTRRFLLAPLAGLPLWFALPAFAQLQQEPVEQQSVEQEPVAQAASPANRDVQQLAADLGSDDYWTRESATKALLAAGVEAVGPLVELAEGDSLEVTCRAVQVLREMSVSDDLNAADAAHQALNKVAASPATAAARRAGTALRFHRRVRADRALTEMLRLGAVIAPETINNSGRDAGQLLIGKQWSGNNDSLGHLKWLSGVTWLSLYNVPVGDAALPHLKPLTFLSRLELYGTQISDAGVDELRAALPETVIDRRKGALFGIRGSPNQLICQVMSVHPDSAAAVAGVQQNDIIRQFDGQVVKSFEDLTALIATRQGGDKVAIEITRGEETLTLEVVLGEWK